eukprot:3458021-Heterocapsa_arctica.AAC.1
MSWSGSPRRTASTPCLSHTTMTRRARRCSSTRRSANYSHCAVLSPLSPSGPQLPRVAAGGGTRR